MILRLRHVCWVIILVFIAGPSHAGQRETIRNLDFETFRIDLLPLEFTIPAYEFTHCERDSYSDIDVIEARIEKPNGETWAHVYQMLPPEDGGSVTCAATELNVHEYCYRSRSPVQASKACGALSIADLSIEAHRAKPDQDAPPEHLYATIDGTLVVIAFADKITWDEIGEVLEAMESMTRVTPSELLNHRTESAGGELWALLREARTAKAHVDPIPFTKLLPNPLPSGFDRIQGYAYWNTYGLNFQTNSSGEHSQLGIGFSETARLPRLKTCWSERACDLVATTPKDRKIYSTRTNAGSSRRSQKAREYYVDIEGTLVILSWPHWTQSEGKNIFRSYEFAPNELETLIDSLEVATSDDLVRFPNMSVMGTYGGKVRSEFSSRVRETSTSDIQIIDTTPVQTDCIRIRDDGSVERVGNVKMQMGQNGGIRRCEP
jgi:hypothetical protein